MPGRGVLGAEPVPHSAGHHPAVDGGRPIPIAPGGSESPRAPDVVAHPRHTYIVFSARWRELGQQTMWGSAGAKAGWAVALLLLGAVAMGAVQTARWAHARVQQVLVEVSSGLGHKVQVGRFSVRLVPSPALILEGITVGSESGTPLLQARAAVVEPDWTALAITPQAPVVLERLGLLGARVLIRHDGKGHWNLEDAFSRWQQRERSRPARELHIHHLDVDDAQVDVLDDTGHTITLRQLDILAENVVPGRPVRALVRTRLEQEGPPAALQVTITINRWPRPGETELPSGEAWLEAEAVDLGPFAGALQRARRALPARVWPGEGHLEARLKVAWTRDVQSMELNGTAHMDGLRLADTSGLGAAADLDVEVEARGNRETGRYAINRLRLTGAALQLHARADLDLGTVERVKDSDVWLQILELGAVRAALPPSLQGPPDMELSGPVVVMMGGRPSQGRVRVVADGATVRVPGWLDKPMGMPATLRANTQRHPEHVQLDTMEAVLGPVSLSGSAHVALFAGGTSTFNLDSGLVPLREVARLVPRLQTRKGRARNRARGTFRFHAHGKHSAGRPQVVLTAQLAGARAAWPHGHLRGDAVGELDVMPAATRGEPDQVRVSLDLRGLELEQQDAEGRVLLRKFSGTSGGVEMWGIGTENAVEAKRMVLSLGRAHAEVTGSVRVQPRGLEVALSVPRTTVRVRDLVASLPWMDALPPGATLVLAGQGRGSTAEPGAVRFAIQTLRVADRTMTVEARGTVWDWAHPRVRMGGRLVHVDGLALARLAGERNEPRWRTIKHAEGRFDLEATLKEPEAGRLSVTDLVVRTWKEQLDGEVHLTRLSPWAVDATLHTARIRVPTGGGRFALPWPDAAMQQRLRDGQANVRLAVDEVTGLLPPPRNVEARVTLAGCRLRVEEGVATLGRGQVAVQPSTMELCRPEPNLTLNATCTDLDVAQMLGYPDPPEAEGLLTVELALRYQGQPQDTPIRALRGTVAYSSPALTVHGLDMLASLKVGTVDAAGLTRQLNGARTRTVDPVVLYNVNHQGTLEDGILTPEGPMTVKTSFGSMTLDGTMTWDRYVDMRGSATLEPASVARLTDGRYRPRGPVTTPIRLLGRAPTMRILEVKPQAFVSDRDLPSMMEAATRAAQAARSRMKNDAERLSKQWEAQAQRGLQDLRTAVNENRPPRPPGLPLRPGSASGVSEQDGGVP